jgi:hypothetical protein
MKYIVYRKDTLQVKRNGILDQPPIDLTDTLGVARCETIPTYNQANGEYLEVFNIQEHTETYTEQVGKEVLKVDEQGNEYTDTEYEEVVKTRPYKTCELVVMVDNKAVKKKRIAELKSKLKETDYQAIKYAEGELSFEEFSPIKETRKGWRFEINALEKEL